MKSGIDRVAFWNVWRLTPEVYRANIRAEWIVKRDLEKLNSGGIEERAEYVLDATINILAADDQKIAATRSPGRTDRYGVSLVRDQIAVYKKADITSEIVSTTPVGLT